MSATTQEAIKSDPAADEASIEKLSLQFSENVRKCAGDKLEQINEANKPNLSDDRFCAGDDFIDATECMVQAWDAVFSVEIDAGSEEHADLWGSAWQRSKVAGFKNQTNQTNTERKNER